jgi:hypothetical protein
MKHRSTEVLVYLLCVTVVVLSGLFIYKTADVDRRAPVNDLRVYALNSPIEQGQVLIVRSAREKVRGDCPVLAQRWAQNISDPEITYEIPAQAWEGGSPDRTYVDLNYQTQALPVGEYEVFYKLTYFCPHNIVFDYGGSFPMEVINAATSLDRKSEEN